MENQPQPMKAALILRQWYTAAKAVLPDAERLQLYDAICAHAFCEPTPPEMSDKVAALWQLIAPALDEDRAKYVAKCERNKANATRSHSQPLAATRSHSQPNTIPNPNPNPNTNPNPSLYQESADTEQKEKFNCIGIFLSRGALDPIGECKRMWDYYTALGWKNNKGAAIVRKTSVAAMWQLKCDVAADITAHAIWHKVWRDVAGTPWVVWSAFRGMAVKENVLHIAISANSYFNEYAEQDHPQRLEKLLAATNCNSLVWRPVE